MTKQLDIKTKTARASVGSDTSHGSVMPPLFLSSNYTFAGFDEKRAYDYTRSGNPTRDALGDAISELEGGVGSTITSSGMSAILVALQLVDAGGLVIAPHDCYGGTFRLLEALKAKGSIDVEYVNQTVEEEVVAAANRSPAAFFVETPSNPLLRITDIEFVVAEAKRAGALVIADNTFLSPALQRPIALGADVVVHSTTKYLNGHSDVVGGACVGATDELHEQLSWWANCLGATGAPFDAYQTLRGLRTLHVRLRQQQEATQAIVAALVKHDAVKQVYYPGLQDHPGHDVARRQQDGFGAMLSFELKGGIEDVKRLVTGLDLFSLAESLGGVESLVAHPATMTHAAMTPEARQVAGISDTLIRLSVGLEAADDLIADLTGALDKLSASTELKLTGS